MKKVKVISVIIFGLLLILGVALFQPQLKSNPQLVMVLFGLYSSVALISNYQRIGKFLFNILLGVLLYINYFAIGAKLKVWMWPNAGWVELDGEMRRVMDMSWLLVILIALILAPITVITYNKLKLRFKISEQIITWTFTITVFLVYIIRG